jgi:aminomethyltransferase
VGKRTPLFDMHKQLNAVLVNFAGWEMPIHYGSQLKEHHQVRHDVGMFDVSHMGIFDISGKDAFVFLRKLLANDVDTLSNGKALYSCMLNERGTILDDLIVYQCADDSYRLVVNAATREKDWCWINSLVAGRQVSVSVREDLAMLAIQGPQAIQRLTKLLAVDLNLLKPFSCLETQDLFIARTGYTGEDGVEIILPQEKAQDYWLSFLSENIAPCGLAARDTLRLEAGFNLYGLDMDETVTPFESNLAWTVKMEPQERDFIGRSALASQLSQGVSRQLVGLILAAPGIMRHHQQVQLNEHMKGEVTSGGYSPTLEKSIGLARIPKTMQKKCLVEIRQKLIPADIIKPPFVRYGKKAFILESDDE